MDFRITGLSAEPFLHLYGLPDEDLSRHGVIRHIVDAKPGFPDRIEMRDGEIGETMLLLNHISQPADTPYRASHAIFVREGASKTYDVVNAIPDVMLVRMLSLRAFDAAGMMLDADVCEGSAMTPVIERMFADAMVSTIHVHNAKRGCYSGRIDRVS